jgi:hypothetical protein
MEQETLQYLFHEVVSALVLLSNPNTPWYEDGVSQINRAMNKVRFASFLLFAPFLRWQTDSPSLYHQLVLRVALSVPADTSLTALIRMQKSLISSLSDESAKVSRVMARTLTKLSRKVINKDAGLDGLNVDDLRRVLSSIDSLMELAERVTDMEDDVLIRTIEDMAKHLVLQLFRRRADDIRVALEGLDCSRFVEPFLSEYEQMIAFDLRERLRERLAQHNQIAQRDVIW